MTTDTQKHYAAFISYAHADEAMAARLHKALETYPVPKYLRAEGRTTKPVFRDVAELTAAHSLSEKIKDAVQGSRVLIVLCSPAAKASHWVNEEIRLFRDLHGDAAILSAIIDGTPETAFPQGLTEGGREPLAAALGSDKAGFKLGVTQLAAGILGTGLDDLIQRGAKRRNRLMGAGMAASLLLSGVMGFTTLQAVEARNDAQTARGEAEGLVEYMIKDLKFKLEPVGRLDLLEGIGDKAVEYYDRQDIKSLNDDSLNRQAAARQVLAQVHLDAGRMNEAQAEIEAAADLTREVFERNPDDTDAIFAHAQSEYWVGQYYRRQGKLAEMEKPWREYDRLAQVLYETDPTNFDWVMEAAWGKNNLGFLARGYGTKKTADDALENYTQALEFFKRADELKPDSKHVLQEIADTMSGKSYMLLALRDASSAREHARLHENFRVNLVKKFPNDNTLKRQLFISKLDYYNDFILKSNDEEDESFSRNLDKLFEIINYDDENIRTKYVFIQSIFDNYLRLDKSEIQLRYPQVEGIIRSLDKGELSSERNEFMLKILEVHLSFFGEDKFSQQMKLNDLILQYERKEQFFNADWKAAYAFFKISKHSTDDEKTIQFSKQFLEATHKRSNINYPTLVAKKIDAYNVLDDCENVILNLKILEDRGYDYPNINDLSNCLSLNKLSDNIIYKKTSQRLPD